MQIPVYKDIIAAHQRIGPFIHKTPVLTSTGINAICGKSVYFKCENLQRAGAFKMRGAMNAVLSKKYDPQKGVITHSSGNHAAALALAARTQNIPCTIIMPKTAPAVKKRAVQSYGANIITCEASMESRLSTLDRMVKETGACIIPPYDDQHIIAGQGTAVLELLEEISDLDCIIVPVGGGGLASGTCIAATNINPGIKVIGVEPELADDARRSLHSGRIIPSDYPDTIADGLRTSLGELNFVILNFSLSEIVTVTEQEIVSAMRLVWERMKIIIEASSAVAVAAVLNKKINRFGEKVGVILSGGNVDLDALPWINK